MENFARHEAAGSPVVSGIVAVCRKAAGSR